MYGFEEEKNSQHRFVETADQAVNDLYISVGGFLVDVLPFCKCRDYFVESRKFELLFQCATFLLGFQVQNSDAVPMTGL